MTLTFLKIPVSYWYKQISQFGFFSVFHDWTEVVHFGHEFNKSTVSFSVNYVKGFVMLIYLITVMFS